MAPTWKISTRQNQFFMSVMWFEDEREKKKKKSE